jgi:hypothetical protein
MYLPTFLVYYPFNRSSKGQLIRTDGTDGGPGKGAMFPGEEPLCFFCGAKKSKMVHSDDFRMNAIWSLSGEADIRATVANWWLVTLNRPHRREIAAVQTISADREFLL